MSEETKEAHVVDRSGWPSGPWDGEPDRVEWKTEAGYVALLVRNRSGGNLCGYVGVEPGHPWHGRDLSSSWDATTPDPHGGVTYNAPCAGHVCHVPAPGEPEHLFWIGFDAAHSGDLMPGYLKFGDRFQSFSSGDYRGVGYMRHECETLAEQAAKVARGENLRDDS